MKTKVISGPAPSLVSAPLPSGAPQPAPAAAAPLSSAGAGRMPGLSARADVPKGGLASQIQARIKGAEKAYSMPPAELTELLVGEIRAAFDFAATLRSAVTAFGGARVKPDHAFFEVGKRWGEGLFLTNVFAAAPEVGLAAIASGEFSAPASKAVQAVALGATVGSVGPTAVGTMLGAVGGAGSPEALAAALHLAAAQDTRSLAVLSSVIRSGAGPGMMEAVAIGYIEARKKLEALFPDLPKALTTELETQGSRILLPFEQETSPFIEKLHNFVHFLPRRLALTEQSAGFVVFPGGFGTLNEVFEVWRADRPVVFESTPFFGPILAALESGWKARGLVSDAQLGLVSVHDGVDEGLPALVQTATRAPEVAAPTADRAEEMASDLIRGMTTLSALPPSVTFFGGRTLAADDVAVQVAGRVAGRLAKGGAALRLGGDGALMTRVASSAKAADPKAEVQAILRQHDDLDPKAISRHVAVHETVSSDAVHKVLLYENTDAFVVLPGGVGTFDELWEIACLMQTGKTPKRPIVLVDDTFWTPILDAMYAAMAAGDQKTIAPEDMRLFTVIKTSGAPTAADAAKPYTVTDEAGAVEQLRQARAERENS